MDIYNLSISCNQSTPTEGISPNAEGIKPHYIVNLVSLK